MIDHRAAIYEGAQIGKNVDIGPFAVIGPDVSIGDGCVISPHAVINGKTSIGKNNRIFQFTSIGEEPIDRSFQGEESATVIGDNNLIRECATIHRGTSKQDNITQIGSNNIIMNYVHIAHDCTVYDHVTFVNYCGLAGHVQVDSHATIGVNCGIHQFCRIGAYSFLAHGTLLTTDVPPYLMVTGGFNPTPRGLNQVGLRRAGFSKDQMSNIKQAYKILYRQGRKLSEALEALKSMYAENNAHELKPFINVIENTQRGVLR